MSRSVLGASLAGPTPDQPFVIAGALTSKRRAMVPALQDEALLHAIS